MLSDIERLALAHYFISFPQHVRMQVIIDDAISDSPQLLFIRNPLYNSLHLSHIMAGVCNLIREMEKYNAKT